MASIKEMDNYAKQWVKEAGTKIRASFENKIEYRNKNQS